MSGIQNVAPGQPAWMNSAWRELGQHEIAGARANPNIRDFYRLAGHPRIASDEVPWCAAFVGACLERAGHQTTRSLMARSYLAWGEPIDEPRLGCIAVFSRGSNPAHGHVGFWVGETADHVLLLGGNQADSVSVATVARSRLLGYRWPSDESGAARAATHRDALFEIALRHVLEVEGGYSNDPHDPGGPTNKGITLHDYARFKQVPLDALHRDDLHRQLKDIPDTEVREIYARFYWRPCRAPELPAALALMHFDAAVNHGNGAASRFLQRAIGTDVDGEVGPQTLAAAQRVPVREALERYAELRRERYRSLSHFWRFGRGWLRRVDIVLRHAEPLIGAPATHQSTPSGEPEMSEPTTDFDVANEKWWGKSVTIWGVMITTLSTVLPTLAPLFGFEITPEMVRVLGEQGIQTVQAIGGLIGTLMTIYGRARTTTRLARREVRVQL